MRNRLSWIQLTVRTYNIAGRVVFEKYYIDLGRTGISYI
jgi:hypothetical protein